MAKYHQVNRRSSYVNFILSETFYVWCCRLTNYCLIDLQSCTMGCLHDPVNVQQTSSKCIQNARANNAGRLLKVCWTFAAICYNGAGRLLDRVNTL